MARKVMQRIYDSEGKLVSKECSKCHKIKSVSEFHKCERNADGLQTKCKECRNENDKKYRQENKDKIKEKNRKFCKQCLSKKLDMIERKCVDCEKIIFINNKFDKKTCRCQECQSEINKQNRQKARIKYRLKQKSG